MSTTLELLVSCLATLTVLSNAYGAGVYGIVSGGGGVNLVQYDINSGNSLVIIQVGTPFFVFDTQLETIV